MSRPSDCNHEDWPCCGCGDCEVSLRHPDYDGPMGIFTGYGEDEIPESNAESDDCCDDCCDGEDCFGFDDHDTPLGEQYGGE